MIQLTTVGKTSDSLGKIPFCPDLGIGTKNPTTRERWSKRGVITTQFCWTASVQNVCETRLGSADNFLPISSSLLVSFCQSLQRVCSACVCSSNITCSYIIRINWNVDAQCGGAHKLPTMNAGQYFI